MVYLVKRRTLVFASSFCSSAAALSCIRADSTFAPIQWETSLQSNAITHWLGAILESALSMSVGYKTILPHQYLNTYRFVVISYCKHILGWNCYCQTITETSGCLADHITWPHNISHDDIIKWKQFPFYWCLLCGEFTCHRWIPLTKGQ